MASLGMRRQHGILDLITCVKVRSRFHAHICHIGKAYTLCERRLKEPQKRPQKQSCASKTRRLRLEVEPLCSECLGIFVKSLVHCRMRFMASAMRYDSLQDMSKFAGSFHTMYTITSALGGHSLRNGRSALALARLLRIAATYRLHVHGQSIPVKRSL